MASQRFAGGPCGLQGCPLPGVELDLEAGSCSKNGRMVVCSRNPSSCVIVEVIPASSSLASRLGRTLDGRHVRGFRAGRELAIKQVREALNDPAENRSSFRRAERARYRLSRRSVPSLCRPTRTLPHRSRQAKARPPCPIRNSTRPFGRTSWSCGSLTSGAEDDSG